MKLLLDPNYWKAVARNPAAITGLVADLAPIAAVLFWGWGAAPLILLYWLENVVIGAVTIPRIALASFAKGGPIGATFGAAFQTGFFIFHYGIFCAVHGAMLLTFFHNDNGWSQGSDLTEMFVRLFTGSLSFAQHMDWLLAVIVAFHLLVLVRDFILGGEWKQTSADMEMAKPYGRIILLHIGVFIIGGALVALGDPAIGALALVLGRAWFGLRANMKPVTAPQPVPAAA